MARQLRKGPAPPRPLTSKPIQAPAPTAATITVEEAAKRLRIGRNQAYEGVHKGEIPSIKIGKRYLVPMAALNRLLGEIV